MKIKIIDLLNKIANGYTPKKISFWGTTYIFDEYRGDWGYVDKSTQPYKWFFKEFNCDLETDLNSEVEIIEESKKIEKIARCDSIGMTHYGEIYQPTENQEILRIKINELIDEINNLKEK